MTALQKVKRTVEKRGLLSPGDSVLVALSGGPDSVALLHILTRLRPGMHLRLGVVYVNHLIRTRAASREERFCGGLCAKWRVEFHLVREDIPALSRKLRQGIEETARAFRYDTFERLADEHGYTRVAVGHQSDDQVETVLFRLFRGTGPGGLKGMPYQRGRIVRPLLDLGRDEIVNHLKRHRIKWCEDASNRSLRYRRNFIRHKLLPAVRSQLNPAVERAILNLAETLGEEEAFLEAEVDRMARKCLTVTPGGKFCLALRQFRSYPVNLRRRLLRRCLKATCESGLAPDKEVVERLDLLAAGTSGAMALPGRIAAEVAGGWLFVYRSGRRTVTCAVEPGRRVWLEWPALTLSARIGNRRAVKLVKRVRAHWVLMDWERIDPPLTIRTLHPGDRFRPLGMKGVKKIGDYLTDRKVMRPLRNETLVLCDRRGPIWLLGFEIADRVKITASTGKVMRVGYSVRKENRSQAI